jgi:hypothetical protein
LQLAETRTETPSEALAQGEDASLELLAAAETDGEVEVRLSCIVVAVYQMRLLIEARDLSRRRIRIADCSTPKSQAMKQLEALRICSRSSEPSNIRLPAMPEILLVLCIPD